VPTRSVDDDMISILLSGPGLIGTQHARLVRAHPRCRLAAVVAPTSEENLAFARAHETPLYASVEAALAAETIDGAIVSSPNEFHFAQAMTCIDRRIPTLVEKPITDRLDEGRRLTEAAEAAGVPILVGHHRTYSPLLAAADGFLHSDAFGDMVALTGSALFYKPAQYFLDGPWRTKIGGGPILINLIHEIGLMRHFAGEIEKVSAVASQRTRGYEVEDTVAMTFGFESGALGTFLLSDTAASSKSWEMTSGENPSYPHFPQENCWHFAGTRGSLDFPSMRTRSYASAEGSSWWKPFEHGRIDFRRRDPLEAQLDHFVAVIADGATPRVTARDGWNNLRVVNAIRRSIATGATVAIASVDDGAAETVRS